MRSVKSRLVLPSETGSLEVKTKKKRKSTKKPRSPYNLFFHDQMVLEREKHPELQFVDLSKIISKRWRELPEESRAVYCQKMKEL